MSAEPFVLSVSMRLLDQGIGPAVLIGETHQREYNNATATFRVGSVLLKFIRDRGQEFLIISTHAEPYTFYQFGEVEIAMGWKSVGEVVKPWNPNEILKPEEMDSILLKLKGYLPELEKAFSGDRERFTRVRLEDAATKRRAAAMRKLQSIRPNT